ncbi:glycine zipper 2TM domain-containing protein [Sinorhizobium meliloti]|uniref:glycine zipper 2TM domain-containing protein n=1 Tax=Rhizobium meliloti TaxID=382 RepID=UPI002E0DC673|nr:glycine zipper 2TM domain-containing protein [Sinorhizobium meliloti]
MDCDLSEVETLLDWRTAMGSSGGSGGSGNNNPSAGRVGSAIGVVVGGTIGSAYGGPMGSRVGGVIGGLAGYAVGSSVGNGAPDYRGYNPMGDYGGGGSPALELEGLAAANLR